MQRLDPIRSGNDPENVFPAPTESELSSGKSPLGASVASGPAQGLPTRYEHFEILRREDGSAWQLGSGAMGTTYKAVDTRLHRVVALKMIRSDLLDRQPVARARFLREARTAASVHHPNIARVFHLGELAGGQYFYAMELVEGESLSDRVRRAGPLPILIALEVSLQVARALAAAARVDLVHRDIKPANLMLTLAGIAACELPTDGHSSSVRDLDASENACLVKIIDFGLARTITPAVSGPLTVHGDFVGTPAFASPEQLADQDDPIDSRSDIFSLGSTLWYIVTGKQPFAGRSLDEIQRLHSRARPVKQLRDAAVPEPVVKLLRAMLAADPDDRPQTPAVLAEMITRCRRELIDLLPGREGDKSGGNAGAPEHHPPGCRRRMMIDVARSAAVASIVGTTGWAIQAYLHGFTAATHSGSAPPASESAPAVAPIPNGSIAVLPFANLSDDKDNAYFAEGIQDEILTRLSQIPSLKVISRMSTQRYTTRPDNLPAIARQLGVAYILEGSVQKSGEAIHLNVQLIAAATDSHVWAEIYHCKLTDLFGVQGEVAQNIADKLHAKLSSPERQAIARPLTTNAEAYEWYLRGIASGGRFDFYTAANTLETIRCLREAVRLDDGFALAWAGLARAQARAYFNRYTGHLEELGELTRYAAEKANALQPDLGEAVLAQGYYYFQVKRDYAQALTFFESAFRLLPNSSQTMEAIGAVSRRQGRWQNALDAMHAAVRLDPRNPGLLSSLETTLVCVRQFAEVQKISQQILDLVPGDPENISDLALAAQFRGDLPTAATLLAPLRPSGVSDAFGIQLSQWAYERRYAPAIAALEQVLSRPDPAWTPVEIARLRRQLARFFEWSGDAASAKKSWRQVRATLEPIYLNHPNPAQMAWSLAEAKAATGDREGALTLIETGTRSTAGADAMFDPRWQELLAAILVRLGEKERALSLIESLLKLPYSGVVTHGGPLTLVNLRLDPLWDPLRAEPHFRELLAGPEPVTVIDR